MRVLWVKMGGLWPLNTGGRQRSFHMLSELARRHQIVLVTTHGPGDDPEGLAQALRHCEGVESLPYAYRSAEASGSCSLSCNRGCLRILSTCGSGVSLGCDNASTIS